MSSVIAEPPTGPNKKAEPFRPLSFSEIANEVVTIARRAYELSKTDIPFLERYSAHLGMIALTIFALLLGTANFQVQAAPVEQVDSNALPPIVLGDADSLPNLVWTSEPLTVIPQRNRREVTQYSVASNDSVSRIASRFGLNPDTILWANSKLEDNPDLLSIGQVLNIPPANGVLVAVAQGDTVKSLADKFKTPQEDILNSEFNQTRHDFRTDPPALKVGEWIMVPNGSKPYVARKVTVSSSVPLGAAKGTSNFIWPVTACVTQYYWQRHPGMDLAAVVGTPVYAADSGFVDQVGWDSTGYGNMILLNHGNGFATRYGHLSAFNVVAGQSVKKGDLIGRIGSTGNSTGPHLHFEVIFQGVHRNPSFFILGRVPGQCYR